MTDDLTAYVEHFRARVLQDALNEATASYWLRRAEQFEQAKPRLGEHFGNRTADDLRAKWRELDEIVRACRNRATVSLWQDLDEETQQILREVA